MPSRCTGHDWRNGGGTYKAQRIYCGDRCPGGGIGGLAGRRPEEMALHSGGGGRCGGAAFCQRSLHGLYDGRHGA